MMNKETCAESALLDIERMENYRMFASATAYPDEKFFGCFPVFTDNEKKELAYEYDRVFRAGKVWLYGAEYMSENEFQRVAHLSDIMGFYRAFGVEPVNDRADAMANEFEFMYYLVLKKNRAASESPANNGRVSVCSDAQKKFFEKHLHPAAKKICRKILQQSQNRFYMSVAMEMLDFLKEEKRFFEVN